ncbi:MAG: trypsin-like peptidase domain-containing protein [Actinomycetota bacterium]|nr:trypsin-like peptidase domain-containing protein [Actinomycetota bacterium]
MNEYGDSEPTDQTLPLEGPWQQVPASPTLGPESVAPTWQWTGTQPSGSTTPSQHAAAPPPSSSPTGATGPRATRRSKALGVAAALLLVGGAAAGGAAFGFAHSRSSSSATGIASGGSGLGTPAVPDQNPTQGRGPSAQPPSNGGSGQGPRQRRGGRASSYTPPGRATAAQQVGVVDINTKLKYEVAKAAGTGMILTASGEVLTNNHVIEGATKIKVTVVATGKTYDATVVGTDKVDDIAVLQLTGASGLATVKTETGAAHVGDAVTAVGNAMGAGGVPSAAKGTVIGVNRAITTQSEGGVDGERLTGMIQVNAQVISGDSGGPLYNSDNQVIGMDTAASSSPAESVGFAIPIATALSIANQIESGQAGGSISLGTPGFLGVQFQHGSSYSDSPSGAVISGVVRKTPAAGLDLLPGDTITSLSGTAITSGDQLKTVLSHYRGGDSVSLTWTDTQGGSHTATVTLIDGPAE